ncbi:MAG: hypothetical protein FJ096_03785 [Deltaproteobacteria bacterium]|nr:hypothetical protein [Deltaproteobacteria bacterium]
MRARTLAFLGAAVVGSLLRSVMASPGDGDAAGIARALGEAVGGEVRPDGFVWERSGGFIPDATWGRGVVFAARIDGPEGPQHDVFRSEVRLSREGRPLAVVAPTNLSRTPLADEETLIARGGKVAFASKQASTFSGVTVLDLAARCSGCGPLERASAALACRLASNLARDAEPRVLLAFEHAVERLELQWHEGALELRADDVPLRLELTPVRVVTTQEPPAPPHAWAVPASRPTVTTALLEPPDGDARQTDVSAPSPGPRIATLDDGGTWPPRGDGPSGEAWTARVAGIDASAPALVTRELTLPSQRRLQLAAIDTRQLELRASGGYARPTAVTGPSSRGAVEEEERSAVVARLDAHPAGQGDGFIDRGRVLVPLTTRPAVAIDDRGHVALGDWSPAGEPTRGMTVVQASTPLGPGPIAALCVTRARHLVYAWSDDVEVAELTATLEQLGCARSVLLEPGTSPLVTGDAAASAAPQADAFFYLVRRASTPRVGPALASLSLPTTSPSWLSPVHRTKIDRNHVMIELTSIDVERFEWRVVAGLTESRGRTFEGALPETEAARVALAIGLGVIEPGRRRGLALGGTVMTPFLADRAVAATHRRTGGARAPSLGGMPSLELGLSADGMMADADAVELVLLAEGGKRRSEARELGELRPRAVLCMPHSNLLLHAEAKLDSPELLVEAMLELGCRRVVSTDRGRQLRAALELRGVEGSPQVDPSEVALVGLTTNSLGQARWLEAAGEDAEDESKGRR